ncbi:MAG: PA0069 family radical SAM protein [Deltaproteobacteria bacterium]|nr:PA0069 family radical SAM protein [Deltaproteobacteria bacterium]
MSRFLPVANPPNRFETAVREYDLDEVPGAPLQVFEDHSRSILARNDSPDVGFEWSVNPYRGCFHACAYCYSRPTHEYLSFGAGTDFERKIVVKPGAPALLREAFDKKSWKGDLVMFSGITDCYQPLEHEMKLTRGCLEVCLEYKNPLGIITKSPIVERDVDLLTQLARETSRCRVSISIPFWNPEYAKAMEPFVTTPARRMKIIETLASAGVPVGVSVSPIVPGLNDEDIGEVLERARDAGASHAFFVLLRLPGAVKEVFERSLREKLPLRAEKVFRRLREAHGGKLYDASFGTRGRGNSLYAKTIDALFTRTAVKLGLKEPNDPSNGYEEPLSGKGADPPTSFVRPDRSKQTSFGF